MNLNYSTAGELLTLCAERRQSIAEITLARENNATLEPTERIFARMRDYYGLMRDSIRKGLEIESPSSSGLSGGDARKLKNYAASASPLLGAQFVKTMAYGVAVLENNASFGRIVATPTAGSSGVTPACLFSLEETHHLTIDQLTMALFTAAGIGHIIGATACFSGAQGGCQAEVGSASCMAAAAIVEATGGTPAQAVEAAAFALMNTLGLVCDPVGGYVEVPCVNRNGMYAVHSFLAASMGLAGMNSRIPLDDVVLAMRDIGRRMPRALKETGEGGLASTSSGRQYRPKPIV
ncbi:MAG: L-serine ammonia-lyase, iron-sulfur-dependent, subunit alpha [Verrucomicrobiae bacterium]|nr:L-serine ammonia-lyase, iron-sulfur-dependent, subunit alpha [Verrucomicrobiae bacterium]